MSDEEHRLVKPIWGMHPQVLAFVVALPLVLPMLIVLTDVHGWAIVLAYGLIQLVFVVVVIGWVVGLVVELVLRKRFRLKRQRVAWYSIVTVVCLILLPFLPGALEPWILKNPKWSRVVQSVHWQTSSMKPEDEGVNRFVLVLAGRGNLKDHKLSSGWLNWTGEGPAGFSKVNAAKMECSQPSEGHQTVMVPLTLEGLVENIMQSGLPEEEVNRIASEMFSTLQEAHRGEPIVTRSGEVNEMAEMTWDQEEEIFGILLWIMIVTGSFQWIARLTLPRAA